MRTSYLSAGYVPYVANLPLMASAGRPRLKPPAGAARAQRLIGMRGLGGLGADVAVVGMSAAKGAATGASVGGPVGAAVGAIIGIAGGLLQKNYLNVAQMNQQEVQEVNAFNQYRGVAGQVAGRDLGYPALNTVLRGAVHSDIFPINNERQCFHEGCSQYPGNPSWADTAMNGGSDDHNTIPDVVPQAIAAGVLDPRQILTQYWIPAQMAKGNHWAAPTTVLGKQIWVDIIDAYVADHAPNAPYFYGTPVNQSLAQQSASSSAASAPQTELQKWQGGAVPKMDDYVNYARDTNGSWVSLPKPFLFEGVGPGNAWVVYNSGTYYISQNGTLVPQDTGSASASAGSSAAAATSATGSAGLDPNTQALITQLLSQGQSQQAAFNAAMQQLASQGQAVTPQLQQQVAGAVQGYQGASVAGDGSALVWVGAGILGLLFLARMQGVQRGRR